MKNLNNMSKIDKAISMVNNLQIPDYFEFMKSQIGENAMLMQLQQAFVMGKTDVSFYNQLISLSKMLLTDSNVVENATRVTTDYKQKAFELLENGEIADLLRLLLDNNRGKSSYGTIAAINISYKEYEKDRLVGKNTTGDLQDITDRLSQLLTKL